MAEGGLSEEGWGRRGEVTSVTRALVAIVVMGYCTLTSSVCHRLL